MITWSVLQTNAIAPDANQQHQIMQRRYFNGALAAMFAILSLLVAVDSAYAGTRGVVPLTSADGVRRDGGAFDTEVTTLVSQMQLGYFVCVFLALPAIDHAFVCWQSDVYERYLARGMNPFRWIEYSFSASTMSALIAVECGILEIKLLIAIVALTALCMFFGWLGELPGLDDAHRTAIFVVGCVPFLIKWGFCFTAFAINVNRAVNNVPDFVFAVVCTLFVLESMFGFNQIRQVRSYVSRELGFMLLSPLAKLCLAGITWGGLRSINSA